MTTNADLIAEARQAQALWDHTPGVTIEVYTGMVAAEDAYRNAPDLVTRLADALDSLHSWDGLMSLLDEHWPDGIFPTLPDDNRRDPGPRIVSLLRWVDELRAERDKALDQVADRDEALDDLRAENEELREALDDLRAENEELREARDA